MNKYIKTSKPTSDALKTFLQGRGDLPELILEDHPHLGVIEWDCKPRGLVIRISKEDYSDVDAALDAARETGIVTKVYPKCRWVHDQITDDVAGFYIDFSCPYSDVILSFVNRFMLTGRSGRLEE